MTPAERRRQKLLARGAQLDARGGGSNPTTEASKKPDEEVKATASPSITSSTPTTQTKTSLEDAFQPVTPKPKSKKVDLNKLMRLMDMKKTYQVSKHLCRVSFALTCGMLFHLGFFGHNIEFLNLQLFAVIILVLYKALDWYEDAMFTRPINVSRKHQTHFVSLYSCLLSFCLITNFLYALCLIGDQIDWQGHPWRF